MWFREISFRGNVIWGTVCQGNICSGNCPLGELSFRELPVGEMSYNQVFIFMMFLWHIMAQRKAPKMYITLPSMYYFHFLSFPFLSISKGNHFWTSILLFPSDVKIWCICNSGSRLDSVSFDNDDSRGSSSSSGISL